MTLLKADEEFFDKIKELEKDETVLQAKPVKKIVNLKKNRQNLKI
jgi:hypothetical protein